MLPEVEEWRAIPGHKGRHEVSSLGRVRTLARRCKPPREYQTVKGRILKQTPATGGYLCVNLYFDGRPLVHHLVLFAFVGPCPPGLQCLHGDDCKTNNRLGNLRWGTRLENAADARANDKIANGERNHSKLDGQAVMAIRERAAAGASQRAMAAEFGVTPSLISMIVAGKRWAHLGSDLANPVVTP